MVFTLSDLEVVESCKLDHYTLKCLYWPAPAAITNTTNWVVSTTDIYFSVLEDGKFKIKVPANLISGGGNEL